MMPRKLMLGSLLILLNLPMATTLATPQLQVRAAIGGPQVTDESTTDDVSVTRSYDDGLQSRQAAASASFGELYVKAQSQSSGTTGVGAGSRMNNFIFNITPTEAGTVDLLLNFDFHLKVHSPGPTVTIFDQAVSSVDFNFIATSMLYQNVGGKVSDTSHAYGHASKSTGLFEDLFDDYAVGTSDNPALGPFPALDFSGTVVVPVRVSNQNSFSSQVKLTTVTAANSLSSGDSGSLAELSFSFFDSDFVTYADGSAFHGLVQGLPAAVPEPGTLSLLLLGLASLCLGRQFTRRPSRHYYEQS